MRLTGWCMKCHKIKLVRVRMPRSGKVQIGICSACEEASNATSQQ